MTADGERAAFAARLEQLLGQLVQNAVEASAADAPVLLAVETIGEQVAIDVATVARKPKTLDFRAAASVPIAALSALCGASVENIT